MSRFLVATMICVVAVYCGSSGSSTDDLIRSFMKTNEIQGLFVAVVKHDSVLYERSFGVSNNTSQTPLTNTTCMELGSVSKAFTAEVIYQLHNEHLLSIEDPIIKYFPAAPASWSGISIRHLLTHTSGIQNYLLDPAFKAEEYFTADEDSLSHRFFNYVPTDSMTNMFYSLPVEFMPGTSWAYSNTGYYLLGKIGEAVTGRKFFDLVNERVTAPLKMNYTIANEVALKNGCLSHGYSYGDSGFKQSLTLTSNYAFSAGAWATTGQDMITFLKAIHQQALPSDKGNFDRESLLNDTMPFAYEGGRFYTTYHGNKIMAHNGGTAGFSSSWIHVVQKNISIIVLMNRQDYAAIDQLAWDVLSLFEPSLRYSSKRVEGDEEKKHALRVQEIIKAVEKGTTYPAGFSKPLQIFMNSENGRGLWKWYFARGFPDSVYCVDVEESGNSKAYRFRLPLNDTVEFRMTVIANEKDEIVQVRWW